jgi:hypothetical protein
MHAMDGSATTMEDGAKTMEDGEKSGKTVPKLRHKYASGRAIGLKRDVAIRCPQVFFSPTNLLQHPGPRGLANNRFSLKLVRCNSVRARLHLRDHADLYPVSRKKMVNAQQNPTHVQ